MRWRLRPRPPTRHGGGPTVAAGGAGTIDLSASLNPLGPSPAALAAARACELGRYPEVDAGSLVEAATRRHRLPPGCVVPVPGASWGLWLCAVSLLRPGDVCLAVGPCFGEYERQAAMCGARYREVRPSPLHAWPAEGLETALRRGASLCLIGNPSNPAGAAVPQDRLRRLCAAHPGTCFVIDEAFAAFAPEGTSLLDQGPPPANAIVVRSLTKELGLPGLRMGYLVATPGPAAVLAGLMPPWPLGAPALAAAVAGLADRGHVAAGAALGRRLVARLAGALEAVGATPCPSAANYLLARAPGVAEALRARGVLVRDCASFGLPDHVRLAAPRPGDLEAVLEAIRSLGGRDRG
jgi:histidinol-phosphate aminotransferase